MNLMLLALSLYLHSPEFEDTIHMMQERQMRIDMGCDPDFFKCHFGDYNDAYIIHSDTVRSNLPDTRTSVSN